MCLRRDAGHLFDFLMNACCVPGTVLKAGIPQRMGIVQCVTRIQSNTVRNAISNDAVLE